MAKMVDCKSCKKEIAQYARTCPHCGQKNPPINTGLGRFTIIGIPVLIGFLLASCSETKYELKKYYKDPDSPAAVMMGSMYAGVFQTFNSLDACLQMKETVERDDREIGYTNSRFVCDKK